MPAFQFQTFVHAPRGGDCIKKLALLAQLLKIIRALGSVAPVGPRWSGDQTDALVIADRLDRRTGLPGELADRQVGHSAIPSVKAKSVITVSSSTLTAHPAARALQKCMPLRSNCGMTRNIGSDGRTYQRVAPA